MKDVSLFLDRIRKDKVKQPSQRGFKFENWLSEYKNCIDIDDASLKDMNIFLAGIIIESLLKSVRDELHNLYQENSPFDNYVDILKSYISISNRDRHVLNNAMVQKLVNNTVGALNMFSLTVQSHDNEIAMDDIATGCVDGMANAILSCIKNIQGNKKLFKGSKPLSKLSFLKKEAYLSQIYHTYETLWRTIVWSNYEFNKIDDHVYEISQPNDSYQQAIILSEQRKIRLHFHTASILMHLKEIEQLNNEQKYLVKSKSFRNDRIKNASQIIRESNKLWIYQIMKIDDYFSSEMLNYKHEDKFSVMDIQSIFKYLSLLSYQYDDSYLDTNIDENEIEKLHSFCPIIKKDKLIKGLVNTTKYKYAEVKDILDFLEYKASPIQDLWANPIISISEKEYAILTSSLTTPNAMRLVELWFKQFEIDLAEKGFKYEETVIKDFNETISKNKLIESFDKAISKRIKLQKDKEEEIDLLCRIGNKILLGELKSILTVDSPISEYRTYDRLKYASEQVRRKSIFVMDNLEDIFRLLNWTYELDEEYEIIGFILNSESSFVGYSIQGIPICDGKILNKYFAENVVPIFSTIDDGRVQHSAKFKLYDNFQQMTENIKIYLENPPQIRVLSKKMKKNSIPVLALEDQKDMIFFSKLIPENFDPRDLLEEDFPFAIEKSDDFDEILEKADILG